MCYNNPIANEKETVSYDLELIELANIKICMQENPDLERREIVKLLGCGTSKFYDCLKKMELPYWKERLAKITKYPELWLEDKR